MRVGVYGLGRFGSFWASMLAKKFTVLGYNRSKGREIPEGVASVAEEEVLEAEVLFLCVSISAFEDVLERITPSIAPGTLVFDTCSVKVHPARLMERILPSGIEIIASHPMFGPDSAREGLDGLPMVLSPVHASQETVEYWRSVFEAYRLKVLEMTPEEHDRKAAYTQGVAHFIGRVLGDLNLKESEIGTLGYHKLLEVVEQTCNDPMQLFLDLQNYNPFTKEMRKEVRRSFEGTLHMLDGLKEFDRY
ncbi:MAG: prephenate dehydrogenase/arogenate dehydrogenase family protein [Spirochaetaceae bacterium]